MNLLEGISYDFFLYLLQIFENVLVSFIIIIIGRPQLRA